MKVRINKYLAERGICSRRKADALIKNGDVFVNGEVATLGVLVDDSDKIEIEGKPINIKKPEKIYIALHKPVGLITSVDPKARDTVIKHIGLKERIFPVGRLDVASSGLLLLTNDGEFSEAITHPRGNHEKEYIVTVDKFLNKRDLQTMADGIKILGKKTKPAKVVQEGSHDFRITLTEGRNRQIRRMCEALGYDVKRLRRMRVMNIELGNLKAGEWRYLTSKEVSDLKKML